MHLSWPLLRVSYLEFVELNVSRKERRMETLHRNPSMRFPQPGSQKEKALQHVIQHYVNIKRLSLSSVTNRMSKATPLPTNTANAS